VIEPGQQAFAGLLDQFKLDWLLRFPLDDDRTGTDGGVHDHLADFQPDQVATPQLAVGRQIEHGQAADPPLALKMEADGPDLLGFEGQLGTDKTALVPWHGGMGMWEWDA
jgi:hypothetical protein